MIFFLQFPKMTFYYFYDAVQISFFIKDLST